MFGALIMGQRLRRRFELPFCSATERILKEFEIVLFTLKPERRALALAMKVMIFSVVSVIEPKLDQERAANESPCSLTACPTRFCFLMLACSAG